MKLTAAGLSGLINNTCENAEHPVSPRRRDQTAIQYFLLLNPLISQQTANTIQILTIPEFAPGKKINKK